MAIHMLMLIIEKDSKTQSHIRRFFQSKVCEGVSIEILQAYTAVDARVMLRTKKPTLVVFGNLPETDNPHALLAFLYLNLPDAKFAVCSKSNDFNREATASGAHTSFVSELMFDETKNGQYLQGLAKTLRKL